MPWCFWICARVMQSNWPLKPGSDSIGASSMSRAVLLRSGSGKGSEVALQTASHEYRILQRLNRHPDDVADLEWISFRYKHDVALASEDLQGCLLLPADYEPRRRYPMIVEVYPNRPGHCADPSRRSRLALGAQPGPYSEYLLAARGCIVFQPDSRGTLANTAQGPLAGLAALVDRGSTPSLRPATPILADWA
jgi:dipeptidyl aminopeptidase/acylaminoacyl peptidase